MEISVAITTYNRLDLTIDSFSNIINDSRITEFVIVDDASTDGSGEKLKKYFKNNDRVKVYINGVNLNMSRNKAHAISLCNSDFILILDSDNKVDKRYLDVLGDIGDLDSNTIYAPVRAKPNFIYDSFSGVTINRHNVKKYINTPLFGALVNTCNYLVNKNTYSNNYIYNDKIQEVDTLWHFYNHIKNGGEFYIVPELEYDHKTHEFSGWLQHANENMAMAKIIEKQLLEL